MTSRITPHLLEPYLALPPEASLVVLTSVLGASTNWLVLRYLHALLKSPSRNLHSTKSDEGNVGAEDGDGDKEQEVAVLLLSFLRDFSFWREGLARLGGLDLEVLGRRGRFGYVDGLGGLFAQGQGQQPLQQAQPQTRQGQQVQPQPSRPGLGLGSAQGPGQAQAQGQPHGHGQGPQGARSAGWKTTLSSPVPGEIKRVVMEGVEQLRRGGTGNAQKVVLVIDGLDFVLAASNPSSTGTDGTSPALAMKEMLMELRENTHATIITLAADNPLIKEHETALEKQHAWFALSLVHEADTLCSLRMLDTGAARDVSGVIRITHRGARHTRDRDHEYLYHVGGDGGVRVFERGQ